MQQAERLESMKQMNQLQDQMQVQNMTQSASAGRNTTTNAGAMSGSGGSNSAGGLASGTNQQQAPLVSQLLHLNSNSFGGGNMFQGLGNLASPTIPTPRAIANPYQLPPTPLPALTPAASATTPRASNPFDAALVSNGLTLTMQQIVASQNSSTKEKEQNNAAAAAETPPKSGGGGGAPPNGTTSGTLPSTAFNPSTVSGASLDLTGAGFGGMAGFNGMTNLGRATSSDLMNQILGSPPSNPNNGPFQSTPQRNSNNNRTTTTTTNTTNNSNNNNNSNSSSKDPQSNDKLPKLPVSGQKGVTPNTNIQTTPSIGSLLSFRGLSDPLTNFGSASGIPRMDSSNGLFLTNVASLTRDTSVPQAPNTPSHLHRGISELSLMSQGNSNFVPYPVNGYFEPPTPGKGGDATPNITTPSFRAHNSFPFNAVNTGSKGMAPAAIANSDNKLGDGDAAKKKKDGDAKDDDARTPPPPQQQQQIQQQQQAAARQESVGKKKEQQGGGRKGDGAVLMAEGKITVTSRHDVDKKSGGKLKLDLHAAASGDLLDDSLGANIITPSLMNMNSLGPGPSSSPVLATNNNGGGVGGSGSGQMAGMGAMGGGGGGMGSVSNMSMSNGMGHAMGGQMGGMGMGAMGMAPMGMGAMAPMGGMNMNHMMGGYGMSMPQQSYNGMPMGPMPGQYPSGMTPPMGAIPMNMGPMNSPYSPLNPYSQGMAMPTNSMGMGPMAGGGGGGRLTVGSPAQSTQWHPGNGHLGRTPQGNDVYANPGGGGGGGYAMSPPRQPMAGGNQGVYQQYNTNAQGNNVPVPRYRSNRGFSPSERQRFGGRGGGGGGGGSMNDAPPSLQDIANMDPRQLTRSNISLSQLVEAGVIEKLARDQNGSRFIQQRLETASLQDKEGVFRQIQRNALALCEDVFGNYVIQKFFEHGTDTHRIELAQIIRGRVLPLTKSMYGCRVIQKAFEYVHDHLKTTLVSELRDHVEDCVRDQNGNHVIQKVIAEVPCHHIAFIVDTFKGKVYHFSTHPYGCRVIQRLLEHCEEAQKEPLLNELIGSILALSKDSYGNYVVQHVLRHGPDQARNRIIREVANNVLAMSKHKFSSNVVEKCFMFGNDEERDGLLDKVIGTTQENSPMVQMVRDQYGNYVIQKLLEVTNVAQRNRLIKNVMELVPNLRKLMFGKHIIAKIEKITGKQVQ